MEQMLRHRETGALDGDVDHVAAAFFLLVFFGAERAIGRQSRVPRQGRERDEAKVGARRESCQDGCDMHVHGTRTIV